MCALIIGRFQQSRLLVVGGQVVGTRAQRVDVLAVIKLLGGGQYCV